MLIALFARPCYGWHQGELIIIRTFGIEFENKDVYILEWSYLNFRYGTGSSQLKIPFTLLAS